MPRETYKIVREDIIDPEVYALERKERRAAVTLMKKNRRLHIGPDATAYFENFDTIVHQIHEMLHIEKGGEVQIEDELRAYATLLPNGRELVTTLMFEIDDPVRRAGFLAGLGGVEETVSLEFAEHKIVAIPETDIDRTNADGKASAIQFLHFPFTDAQAQSFKDTATEVVLAVAHEKYAHMAKFPKAVQAALAEDLA